MPVKVLGNVRCERCLLPDPATALVKIQPLWGSQPLCLPVSRPGAYIHHPLTYFQSPNETSAAMVPFHRRETEAQSDGQLARCHAGCGWHSWDSHQACLPTKPGSLSGPTHLAPTLSSVSTSSTCGGPSMNWALCLVLPWLSRAMRLLFTRT